MKNKEKVKIFQRSLARYGMFITAGLCKLLPFCVIKIIAQILIAIGYCFVIRQKRLAFESLTIAFRKEKSPREIKRIIRKCFWNFGWGMIEMIYYLSHPKDVLGKVTIQGRERLEQAIQAGNGVIAVTAHFGNFPLMMLCCTQSGFKASSIIRPARDRELEEYLLKNRTEVGLHTIYALPRQACVNNSLKALRKNEMVFIPLDQNFGGGGGVFVDFFGQKAATATGPVVFAMRTKAPIIPMFIVRGSADSHKIIIEEPIPLPEGKNEKDTILLTTEKITKLIESYIRKYPHEWGWMHRRWKSRPSGSKKDRYPGEKINA